MGKNMFSCGMLLDRQYSVAGFICPVEGKMPSLPGEKGIVMTMFLTDIGKRVMILAVKSKNETC